MVSTLDTGPKKLATIMAVDLAGYSALAETDERAAIEAVERVRAELAAAAAREGGRIFNTAGDGFMLEFASVSGALAAAEQVCAANDCRKVRIGLHLGDVMVTATGDMLGHGVNVAARLQQMAKPGVVLVSVDIRRAVRGALANRLHAHGSLKLNKMAETIETFTLGVATRAFTTGATAAPAEAAPVLAVLPFDNENEGVQLDFFADGVADEIMLILMRQSALKVIGRTSAFQFRGRDKSAAAAALRASHVLDGAVRRTKTKVRVNTQLIEAGSGVALWSQRYDRNLVDAFEVQDDIAAEVARALSHALTHSARQIAAVDPAAYDLYLRARRTWLTLSDVEEEQAETLLEKCVARAPEFASAWADLASVRAFLLPRDRDVIGEPQHQAALDAADRALALDPDHPRALAALALLKPAFGAYSEKIALTRGALDLTPNDPELHVAHSTWLYGVGRVREALDALEIAVQLDPRGPAIESFRASLLATQGDIDGALDVVSAAWSRWPDSAFTWYMMWVMLSAADRLDDALALAAPEALPKHGVAAPDVQVLKNYVGLLKLPEAQRAVFAGAFLAGLANQATPLPLSACMVAVASGCADQAYDLLDAALDSGRAIAPDPHVTFGMARAQAPLQMFVHSGEAFRRHKRFPGLCARLGLAEYWLNTDQWPDCASEVDYDFKAACAEALGR